MSETTLPSMRVDGQVALVTGAGRGIGRGCAIALAEAGAEVIAMSRTEAELKEVVAEIQDAGGTATPVVCDVSDGAAVRERISEIQKLDILVNNAGILRASSLLELSEEDLDDMLQINCRGAVLVAQAAVRSWNERFRCRNQHVVHIWSQWTSKQQRLFSNQTLHRRFHQINSS